MAGRIRVSAWALVVAAAAFATVSGLPGPASAQTEWVPFKTDDKPVRPRRGAPATEPSPPPLAPMDGILYGRDRESRRPEGAPQPGFGQAYPGTQDRLPYGGQSQPAAGAPDSTIERQALPPIGPAETAGAVTPTAPQPGGAARASVERPERDPVRASDATGLPQDAWRGLDLKAIEGRLVGLPLPPRSPALSALFKALMTAETAPPAGAEPQQWTAVTLEALYRAGLVTEMGKRLPPAASGDVIITAFKLRHDLARGDHASVCTAAKGMMTRRSELPKVLSQELHLLSGYCAAVEGNTAGAGLAAEVAREDGVDAPLALGALDALSGSGKTGMPAPKRVHVLDYRLLEVLGPVDAAEIVARAEPALLTALALDPKTDPKLRVAAAELAAAATAITPQDLAEVYRAIPKEGPADPLFRRAILFKAVEAESQPGRKLAAARALLDDARRTALYLQIAALTAAALDAVPPGPDQGPGAEAGIEAALAIGDGRRAQAWIAANPGLRHWQALADIVDPQMRRGPRDESLQALEEAARRGRFGADTLHRLATVLDALDVNVPIPLWEAASRTPQPNTGHLPPTGVLPELQDAAKQRQAARTILLTLTALGGTAKGAHIIALGDSMRALRRAGFEGQARMLGIEAVLQDWPRIGGA